jgi:hypothetical protein
VKDHYTDAFLDRERTRLVKGLRQHLPNAPPVSIKDENLLLLRKCFEVGDASTGFNDVTMDAEGITVSPFSIEAKRIRFRQTGLSSLRRFTMFWPWTCQSRPRSTKDSITSGSRARCDSSSYAKSVRTDLAFELTMHAVMSQRVEDRDSLDNFPTPPWATRALIEHVIGAERVKNQSVLEPACGEGFMSRALSEYFASVRSFDIHGYGYGYVDDFLTSAWDDDSFDWVITNPPFKAAEEFVTRGLQVARCGVAVLVRTVFIESVGRWQRLFRNRPCTAFAQFVERVPIVKGRVDPRATTATGYAWLVWDKTAADHARLVWIPPSRRALERKEDYCRPADAGLFAA